MVQVQHAEHAALVHERHAEGRLDVETLAHDAERLAIGLAAQPQRTRLLYDASGDAFAHGYADLVPELGLDAHGHSHAQLALCGVEQHHGAALGVGHTDRDLEHAAKELVGIDGQIVGLDDLVQHLQQLRLAVAAAVGAAPEQPGDERA